MGELARQPGCPDYAQTPLELLTPRPGDDYFTTERLVWPVLGAVSGITFTLLGNKIAKRPLWAGIHIHFLMALGGSYLFHFLRETNFAAKAEADAVMKHYITLHPDDFPPFERKRWRDVYKPFSPVR